MNRFVLAATAMLLVAVPAPAQAVEYVRICDLYGASWFYIPGSTVCVNALTGETREEVDGETVSGVTTSQQGIVDASASAANAKAAAEVARMRAEQAVEGVAIGLAMRPAMVTPGNTYGMSLNIGTFDGKLALGLSAAIAAGANTTFTTSLGVGLQHGGVAGQAGVNFSW